MTKRYSHAVAVDNSYDGDFASIAEALADFRKQYPANEHAYIGVRNDMTAADLISPSAVIDDLQQRAYDEVGEHCEDWLTDVTVEQKNELYEAIAAWANKHHPVTFYQVTEIREYVAATGHDNGPV